MKTLMENTIETKTIKKPVVVLPLKEWEKIDADLENLEMIKSINYRKKIAKARQEKKIYSEKQIKRLLKI